MLNYFKENKLYRFDTDTMIISDYDTKSLEFCIDDSGLNLLNAINIENLNIDKGLLNVNDGMAKIKLLDKVAPKMMNEYENSFELDLDRLKEAVSFSSKSTNNPVLTGVYVSSDGTIVSFDSYKAYISYVEPNDAPGVILSKEFVNLVTKYTGKAITHYNAWNSQVEVAGKTIIGRLVLGKYPLEWKYIKTFGQAAARIERNRLLDILNVGKLVGSNANVLFDKSKITFTSDEGNEYVAEYNSDIETYIKLEYLMDALKIMDDCTVVNQSPTRPLLFTQVFDKTTKHVILLPMVKMK